MGYKGLYRLSNWYNKLISHSLANTSGTSACRPSHSHASFWALPDDDVTSRVLRSERPSWCIHTYRNGKILWSRRPFTPFIWMTPKNWVNMVVITSLNQHGSHYSNTGRFNGCCRLGKFAYLKIFSKASTKPINLVFNTLGAYTWDLNQVITGKCTTMISSSL